MKTRVVQEEPDEPGTESPRGDRPEPRRPTNVAARMARWSAHHRKKAIFGWLGLAVGLFAISIVSPLKQIVFETSGPGESGRADTIIYNEFKQPGGESVLVQNHSVRADAPEFRAVVLSVVQGLSSLEDVAKVESPYAAGNAGQVSDDRHSVLVPVEIRGPETDAADKVDPIVERVADVQRAQPALLRRFVRREHR